MSKLAHKSLVVIGGTSGLGLSAARAFIAAGARVVVVGRDEQKVKAAETPEAKDRAQMIRDVLRALGAPKTSEPA